MLTRVLPALVTLGALAADSRGAHTLAFYLVLAAVPAAAAAGLAFYGDLVVLPGQAAGERRARAHALLAALALALLLLAASVRAPARLDPGVPALGLSPLVAALALYALQALLLAALPAPQPARA